MAVTGAATDIASGSSHQRRAGLGPWLFLTPMLGWLLLFVIVPTLMLVVVSFGERDSLGRVIFAFNLDNYVRAFDWIWLRILGVSVWYAFLTTVICLILGYPVAYFIGRSDERWRGLLIMLVMIPFWTSFLIRTYAWIAILSQEGLLNALLMGMKLTSAPIGFMYTPFAVVLGLVYNFLPFMILPIYTSVEKLDGSLIEAAYDLGARPARVFAQVVLPLTKPGIAAGILLVFVPAIAMFAITTLMGGGGNPTIGEVIQNQFTRARNQPFGAALGVLLLILFIFSLWATTKLRRGEEE
ncbi:MAG: ABC transporter permease [Chthoniobacterales bacterium]|nr:ABC transporter permease [Chthoniobacterales bacterium]